MACHLIEEAKKGSLDRKEIEESIEDIEQLADSDKFDVRICKCRACGQVYINCFREFNSLQFQDYYWTFWLPATPKDVEDLKKAKMTYDLMADVIRARPHICWDDKKTFFWSENGNPRAPTLFLPPYMFDYPE